MSVNSSSNSSFHPALDDSDSSGACTLLFTALFISSVVLLLPLLILVLYVSYQRWRKRRSVATAAATSHSDVFTFNMVALEIVSVFGLCFHCYGVYANQRSMTRVGTYIYSIISPGQTLFHLLTCVERYLAVVHPVTYLGLRQAGGVRIRNLSVGCVWLISFGSLGLWISGSVTDVFNLAYAFILLILSFLVISFCCLSVLRVLIRPGPGEVGGNRERVDQSKLRAFRTMTAIIGALLLRFLSILVSIAIFVSPMFSYRDLCVVMWSAAWFSLPSSLVLPLLFLHRAGKLPRFKHNTA